MPLHLSPKKFIAALLAALLALAAGSQSAAAIEFPNKPDSKNFYVDEAGLITPEDRKAVDEIALKLFVEESVPMFVVTIQSLSSYQAAGYTIEKYAQELFDHWGIGSKDRNYGILLLVSKGDRKARIELGADWGRTHDSQAQNIMDDLIIPHFKAGRFSMGILDGVRGLDAMARGLALPPRTAPWWFWPAVILSFVFMGLLIYNLFKTGRSGWAWALIAFLGVALFFMMRAAASSGGSSGGFGGGFSGGGGATGSW